MQAPAEEAGTQRVRRAPTWPVLVAAALAVGAVVLVVAVVLSDDDDALRLSHLSEGVTAQVVEGTDVFVARHGTEVRVFLPDARHLAGATVWWCPNEQIFLEAEHGSLFDHNGRKIVGPARGALHQHPVELDGDRLVIDTGRVVEGTPAPIGQLPAGLVTSSGARWPPNSGPESICQDPVAAPPSGARRLESPAGPQH